MYMGKGALYLETASDSNPAAEAKNKELLNFEARNLKLGT